jgi:hypothetical protein
MLFLQAQVAVKLRGQIVTDQDLLHCGRRDGISFQLEVVRELDATPGWVLFGRFQHLLDAFLACGEWVVVMDWRKVFKTVQSLFLEAFLPGIITRSIHP